MSLCTHYTVISSFIHERFDIFPSGLYHWCYIVQTGFLLRITYLGNVRIDIFFLSLTPGSWKSYLLATEQLHCCDGGLDAKATFSGSVPKMNNITARKKII